ncbi:GNAT family N-acetyltransferase [Arthrobacter sp. 7Tela_A1]|uniref:GNAT family N-acetyltransferase n=1 Tax=Arthrobacter sp. 7Tela_A1 TaxID=3093745 RepID=UPI003BB666DF
MTFSFLPMVKSGDETRALVQFLTSNRFPFHVMPAHSEESARKLVEEGRFWSGESIGFWIDNGPERIGLVVLDDLEEDSPMFDLRLAEEFRGRGMGVQVLKELCAMVFDRFPEIVRFEGQTREDNIAMRRTFLRAGFLKEAHYRLGWPTADGTRVASVAYAILRQDWENQEITPFDWEDISA